MPGEVEAAEITNPRRILAVSLEQEANHLSRILKDLTNSAPQPASTSLAGTTHDLSLKTAYYTATVPIWIDLIASPAAWAESFLSPEAKEVLGVLGGLVLVFSLPATAATAAGSGAGENGSSQTKDLIRHFGRVVAEGLGGWEWDGVGLAVGVGEGDTEEWDDLCAGVGLEFVHFTGKQDQGTRNEFGEKTGIPRIKEALEANDWAQFPADNLSDFGDFTDPAADQKQAKDDDGKEFDPESLDFGYDRADFEGLKQAIWTSGMPAPDGDDDDDDDDDDADDKAKQTTTKEEEGSGGDAKDTGSQAAAAAAAETKIDLDDEDIEKVERMMRKLQAVREAGEGMGLEQRRRMAARAVEDVMREL